MSYEEYEDLRRRAIKKAPYEVWVFDVVGSRNRTDVKECLSCFLPAFYEALEAHEQAIGGSLFNRKDERFIWTQGDLMAFMVWRNKLSLEQVLFIGSQVKQRLNLDLCFHVATPVPYETAKWSEGDVLYYRDYAIAFADNQPKPWAGQF